MKTILLSFCFLFLGLSVNAQKLYTDMKKHTEYINRASEIEELIKSIDGNQVSISNQGVDKVTLRNKLNIGDSSCKSLVQKAQNSSAILEGILSRSQMNANEYETFLKKGEGSGYYTFTNSEIQTMESLSKSMSDLYLTLKNYSFKKGTPSQEDAKNNLENLKNFSLSYNKFVEILDKAYVKL